MPDTSVSADEGFEILADPTRLKILQALADQLRELPEDPSIGFSDLRREVGVRDSGNFNYHLDKLTGRYVKKTDGAYRITGAGMKVVAAAIAGVYTAGQRLGPKRIDEDCPLCDEPLTATYENGLLTVACSNEHDFRNPLPPGSIDERDIEEIVELVTRLTHQNIELATEGICPMCNGRLEWSVRPPLDGEFPHFTNQCSRCGATLAVPVGAALLTEPAVISFYHDHDIDIRRRPLWTQELYTSVTVSVESDPVRIDVTIECDDDSLTAMVDETLAVRDIQT